MNKPENNEVVDIVKVVSKGAGKVLGPILKAGLLVVGMGIAGGTIAAIAAANLAGWGALAVFGCFVGGGLMGVIGGVFMAKEYLFSKAGKAIETVNGLTKDLEELEKIAQKLKAQEPAPAVANTKDLGASFTAANENKPADAAVAPAQTTVEVKKEVKL